MSIWVYVCLCMSMHLYVCLCLCLCLSHDLRRPADSSHHRSNSPFCGWSHHHRRKSPPVARTLAMGPRTDGIPWVAQRDLRSLENHRDHHGSSWINILFLFLNMITALINRQTNCEIVSKAHGLRLLMQVWNCLNIGHRVYPSQKKIKLMINHCTLE